MSFYRARMATLMDVSFINWKLSFSGVRFVAAIQAALNCRHFNEELCRAHIRNNAPERYHEFLIPRYPIGTVRRRCRPRADRAETHRTLTPLRAR